MAAGRDEAGLGFLTVADAALSRRCSDSILTEQWISSSLPFEKAETSNSKRPIRDIGEHQSSRGIKWGEIADAQMATPWAFPSFKRKGDPPVNSSSQKTLIKRQAAASFQISYSACLLTASGCEALLHPNSIGRCQQKHLERLNQTSVPICATQLHGLPDLWPRARRRHRETCKALPRQTCCVFRSSDSSSVVTLDRPDLRG